jgi:hypothetical protein
MSMIGRPNGDDQALLHRLGRVTGTAAVELEQGEAFGCQRVAFNIPLDGSSVTVRVRRDPNLLPAVRGFGTLLVSSQASLRDSPDMCAQTRRMEERFYIQQYSDTNNLS